MDLKRIYDYMTGRPETYKGLKDVGYDDFEKSMGDARYRRGVYNQLYINGGINSKYDVFEGSWQKTYGEPAAGTGETGVVNGDVEPVLDINSTRILGAEDFERYEAAQKPSSTMDTYDYEKMRVDPEKERQRLDAFRGELEEEGVNSESVYAAIDAGEKEIEKGWQEAQKRRDEERREDSRVPVGPNFARVEGMYEDTPAARDLSNFSLAKDLYDDARNLLDASFKGSGFGRGVWDAVYDVDAWTAGLTELGKKVQLNRVYKKAKEGEELTASEARLLDAANYYTLAGALHQAYLPSTWYRWGQGFGGSIPYMLEFALTYGPASSVTKGLARAVFKKLGGGTVGRVGGEAIYGMTTSAVQTPLNATNVVSGTYDRMMGNAEVATDENGVPVFIGMTDQKGFWQALGEATGAQYIENLSEVSGRMFSGIGHLIKRTAPRYVQEGLKKISDDRYVRAMADNAFTRGIRKVGKRFKIGNAPEEIYEEYFGGTINGLLIGDTDLESLFSMQSFVDITGTVAVTQVFLGALGASMNHRSKRSLVKRYEKAEREYDALFSSPEERDMYVSYVNLNLNGVQGKGGKPMLTVLREAVEKMVNSHGDNFVRADGTFDTEAAKAYREEVSRVFGNYFVAKQLYDSYMAGIRTRKEADRERIATEMQEKAVNGQIMTVTLADGRRARVVSGDIVVDGDGRIDVGRSGDHFTAVYEDDGSTVQLPVEDSYMVEVVSVEDAVEAASRANDELINREEEEAVYGPRPKLGETVTMLDSEGNRVQLVVSGEVDESGNFMAMPMEDFDNNVNGMAVAVNMSQIVRDDAASEGVDGANEYQSFVNEGTVSDATVERIAGKIANGESLTAEEEAMRQGANERVEGALVKLRDMEGEKQEESALSRIEKDAKGQPLYEKADVETAWDALVEQSEGDESIARDVAASMVKDKEAALKKMEKAPAKGATPAEKIADAKVRKENIDKARAELEHWQAIAGVPQTQAVGPSNPEINATNASMRAESALLSTEEKDEFGNPMVLAKDGTTVFGTIDSESGLTAAPIKLSLGENRVDGNGTNHGYGLLHIEAGHGEQIRKAGYKSVEDFVEVVAKNYTDIREGAVIGDNQTYLLEVSDEHNNTLFIQLSRDGSYWNINSAGIFKKKYSRRKPKVYSVPAVGESTNTDTPEVDSDQYEGVIAPAGNSSKTFSIKDNEFSEENQGKSEGNAVQTIKEETNTDYEGEERIDVLAGDNASGQGGQQSSPGRVDTGERDADGVGTTDEIGAGTRSDGFGNTDRGGIEGAVDEGQSGLSRPEVEVGLNEVEASDFMAAMEAYAVERPIMELNPSNWEQQFGTEGKVSTPIGTVKMGENQISKLFEKGRSEQFGMIKPTLETPLAIIEVPSEATGIEAERASSLLFVKTFIGKNGEKIYYFKSVTVKKDGMEVSVSSHYDRPKRIKDALINGKLLYRFDGGAQTEHHPADASVTASRIKEQGISTSESRERIGEKQGKSEENAVISSEEDIDVTVGRVMEIPDAGDRSALVSGLLASAKAEEKSVSRVKNKVDPRNTQAFLAEQQRIRGEQDKARAEVAYWEEVKRIVEESNAAESAPAEPSKVKAARPKSIRERISALGEVLNLRDYILRALATGEYKFIWGDNRNGTKGLGSHLGFGNNRRGIEERQRRIWLLNNEEGLYPEQVAELLYANIQAEYPYLAQDDVEVFNEMLDVLRYDSAKDMVSEAEDMRRRREEMYEEYDSDQAMYDATMQERDERVDAENEAYRRELESQESGTPAEGRAAEPLGDTVADAEAEVNTNPTEKQKEAEYSSIKTISGESGDAVTDNLMPNTETTAIQGFDGYSQSEIKSIVQEYIQQKLDENDISANVVGIAIHGSRGRGNAKENSDLDVVVEYEGDIREDGMFNLLNYDDNDDALYIEGIRVDINPIRAQETGTLDKYMERSRKYDEEVLSNDSVEDSTVRYRRGEDGVQGVRRTQESEMEREVRGFGERMADRLGGGVRLVYSDEIADSEAHAEEKRRSKGYYDTATGEVVVVLDNNTEKGIPSVIEVAMTMMHEVVGHKGVRGLFGTKEDAFLDDVYRGMKARTKAEMESLYGGQLRRREGESEEAFEARRRRLMADEYIARVAEEGNNPGLLRRVGAKVRGLLRGLGVELAITDNEIRDILRRSARELTRRKDGAMNVREDGDVRYREKNGNNKKSALETAAAARRATIPTAISSTDGTKILKNLDNLAKEYEEKKGNRARTFVGDVADALGIEKQAKSSKYAIFETKNGRLVTIRLSNHNATVSNFDNVGEREGISIVVTGQSNNGITNDGEAHVVEFFYSERVLRQSEGKPLSEIIRSIKQSLYSGEFNDKTGLAEREEVNVREDGDVRYRESVNERFNKELEQQIDGTLPKGHIYQLGLPGEILRSTGIPDLPIELSSARLAEKAAQRNHEFELSDVKGLPEALENPIAIFSYGNKDKAQNIIVEIEKAGKKFVVGLHLNQYRQGIEVNSIRGIFPKDNAEWLNWISQGKLLYVDKNKIQDLIDKQRTNLADVEYLDLDSITNIVKEFENPTVGGENVRYRLTEEEQGIVEAAKRDGSYMKAPNGAPTRLTEKQWAGVRTKAFKAWFGDWEKAARIEKLRKSEPVEISGEEITPSDDLKQYKKNALEYGKRLQGNYTNKDTGREIQLQRGRKNGGLKEVLQHDINNVVHIQSVAAIPQIIENAVYIDSAENRDMKKNPQVAKYHYYVCGLKIGGEDYTVRMVEAEEKDGSRYYDHKLTHIEKGKLIEELAPLNFPSSTELSSTPGTGTGERNRPTNRGETQTAPVSKVKDNVLLSLLQVNSSKVVDENGEPTIFEPTEEVDKSNGAKSDIRYRAAEADYASVQEDASGEYAEALSAPMDISVADMMPIEAAENAQAAGLLRDVVNRFPDTKIAITDLSRVYAAAEVAEEEATEVRYRRGVNERFNEELERQIAGELPKGHVYSLGRPSEVLLAAGIPDLPIELAASRLGLKASAEYESNHPFELREVMNLPEAIQHPIAVFDSKTRVGSKVILVELKDRNGNNFVVAMNTNVPKSRYSKASIQINDIRSIYPKDNVRDIVGWISRGDLLRYADKKKIEDWITQQRSNSAEVEIQNLDVAANIVKEFENPTIDGENVRYRREVNERFNEELERQIAGELPKGHVYSLGRPSEVLLAAGIPDLPIELAASRLSDKSMQDNHPYDLSEVKDLPQSIQAPMAVFRSATHIGSFVVMTEIEHRGRNFVVAIEANRKQGRIEVNSIRSIHYRRTNAHIANWIEEGLLEYADKKRVAEWFSKQRYNSADVRKLFNHAANIVKEFENPAVDGENVRYRRGISFDTRGASHRDTDITGRRERSFGEKASRLKEKAGISLYDEQLKLKQLQGKVAEWLTGSRKGALDDRLLFYEAENQAGSIAMDRKVRFDNEYRERLFALRAEVFKALGNKVDDKYYFYAKTLNERTGVIGEEAMAANKATMFSHLLSEQHPGHDFPEGFFDPKEYGYEALQEYARKEGWIDSIEGYIADCESRMGEKLVSDIWGVIGEIAEYQLTTSMKKGLITRDHFDRLMYGRPLAELVRENLEKGLITEGQYRAFLATDFTADELVKAGFITREQREGLKRRYEYYLPLKGDSEPTTEEVADYERSRSRVSWQIKSVKGGNTRLVNDPVSRLLADVYASISYQEKMAWIQSMYHALRLAERQGKGAGDFAILDNWVVKDETGDYVPYVRYVEGEPVFTPTEQEIAKGEVERARNLPIETAIRVPEAVQGEHIVKLKHRGRTIHIYFRDPAVANAVNNHFVPRNVPKLMKGLRAAGGFMGKVYTQWNIFFSVRNLSKDFGEAAINNYVQYGGRYMAEYMVNYWRVMRHAGTTLRGAKRSLVPRNDYERRVEEFFKYGGEVSYTQIESYDKAIRDFERELKRSADKRGVVSVTEAGFVKIGEAVSAANKLIELNARLATFITSRERGYGLRQSIRDAKEVTVNFDRRGRNSMEFGSLFLFWNAGRQSNRRKWELMRENPGRFWTSRAAMGLLNVAQTYVLGSALAAVFGIDWEDYMTGYYDIPDYIRYNNIVVMSADGKVYRIPLSPAFAPYKTLVENIGEATYRTAFNDRDGRYDWGKGMADIVKSVSADLGDLTTWEAEGGKRLIGWAPAPTVPLLEAMCNVDFTGRPVYKVGNSATPGYKRAYAGTKDVYVEITEWLNRVSGGEEAYGSWVGRRANPGAVQHVVEGYLGGLIQVLSKFWNVPEALKGASYERLPFVDTFYYGDAEMLGEREVRDDIYDARRLVESYNDVRSNFRKTDEDYENNPKTSQYLENNEYRIDELKDLLKMYVEVTEELKSEDSEAYRRELRLLRRSIVELTNEMEEY